MEPKKHDYSMMIASAVIIIPAVILIMTILSYGAGENITLYEYTENLNAAIERLESAKYGIANPLIYFELANEYTGKFVFAGCLIMSFVFIYIIAGKRNYIKGREYGTDKYANVHIVNKRLKDPDKKNIFEYKYEKYTLFEKAAANFKCERIKRQKRKERRKRGISE